MIFTVSDAWRKTYPGACVGVLAIRDVINPERNLELDQRKSSLEIELRERFSSLDRSTLETVPPFPAYIAYYKQFKKTYHVFLQLESIVFKGKSIPSGASLVEAMFMAELENMLLTAGHDLDRVASPVRLDVATGDEHYIVFKGQDQVLKPSDMYISDAQGVISDIIYGPDLRTQIRPDTRNVLFTTYAPPGVSIEAVHKHLSTIRENIELFSPAARVEFAEVISTE